MRCIWIFASLFSINFCIAADIYKEIYNKVDQNNLIQILKQTTGVVPVTVGNETFSITNRYSSGAKAKFRKYWTKYFTNLGIPVKVLCYPTSKIVVELAG